MAAPSVVAVTGGLGWSLPFVAHGCSFGRRCDGRAGVGTAIRCAWLLLSVPLRSPGWYQAGRRRASPDLTSKSYFCDDAALIPYDPLCTTVCSSARPSEESDGRPPSALRDDLWHAWHRDGHPRLAGVGVAEAVARLPHRHHHPCCGDRGARSSANFMAGI